MESVLKDIRYGFRGLLRRPWFTVLAVITLALGIGANTAIFTLINAVIVKPLPVSMPEELVLFDDSTGEGTSNSTGDPRTGLWHRFPYYAYRYLREHDQAFTELSAFRSGESRMNVRFSDAPSGAAAQRARGHLVSGNYFAVLSANAMQGRVLTNEDDAPAAPPAAVISYSYWKQQLNGDSNALGKSVVLNGTAFTIVGVMPPEFFGVRVRRAPDFWLPLAFQPQIEMRPSYLDDPETYFLNMLGRLKPGTTIEQAQAKVNVGLRQLLTDRAGSRLSEERRRGIENTYVTLAAGGRGISGLRVVYARALRMLMVIVTLVLLIACGNVGNLLLSRAAARQAEVSLRQALGASRARLIRQMLTESLLLALIGGVCGVLIAQWGVSILVARVARSSPLDVRPDFAVLAFTVGITLAAGILFGLAPALRATRPDLSSALKERVATGGRGRSRLASTLVILQVALSLVLLTGAGLFLRSLLKLYREDLGFKSDNVLIVSADARLAGYKPNELSALYRQLYDRLSALPNVQSASIATYSPMEGTSRTSSITVRGYTPGQSEDMVVADILIGPDYCATLGLPVMLGRDIGSQDTIASRKIAVVNQAFAQYFFPNQNPLGRLITFEDESDKDDLEIVGVVGDVKYRSARQPVERTVYHAILQVQNDSAYASVLELRTEGDPSSLAGEVRGAIAQVDQKLPVVGVTSLRTQTEEALAEEKLIAQMVSFFGLLALLLACVGLYGVMAHAVVRRTNEIGIRMALGADRRKIIWMVLRETLVLVGVGIGIGVPAALGAGQLVSSQLFGVSASDPPTLLAAAVSLTGVAALAGYLPARRASRVDPLVALRYE